MGELRREKAKGSFSVHIPDPNLEQGRDDLGPGGGSHDGAVMSNGELLARAGAPSRSVDRGSCAPLLSADEYTGQ